MEAEDIKDKSSYSRTSLSSKVTSPALFLQASSNQVDHSRLRVFHLPGDLSTCHTEADLWNNFTNTIKGATSWFVSLEKLFKRNKILLFWDYPSILRWFCTQRLTTRDNATLIAFTITIHSDRSLLLIHTKRKQHSFNELTYILWVFRYLCWNKEKPRYSSTYHVNTTYQEM